MAEIAHMHKMLHELQRLSVSGEAPTKLEGGFVEGVAKVWNEDLGFVGAGYVKRQCDALLSAGSDRLPAALKTSLTELQTALREAKNGKYEMTSRNNQEAARQDERQRERVESVRTKYQAMTQAVRNVVDSLVTTTGLNWEQARAELSKQTQQPNKMRGFKGGEKASDAFAVALSAFLTAIHKYLYRHID